MHPFFWNLKDCTCGYFLLSPSMWCRDIHIADNMSSVTRSRRERPRSSAHLLVVTDDAGSSSPVMRYLECQYTFLPTPMIIDSSSIGRSNLSCGLGYCISIKIVLRKCLPGQASVCRNKRGILPITWNFVSGASRTGYRSENWKIS